MASPVRYLSILALLSLPAQADQAVIVTGSSLNVRTGSGAILCEVKKDKELNAVGRADGEWIKVKISDAPGCPAEGFVHSGYVKVKGAAPSKPASALVETGGLSFRSAPNLSEESFECALPKGTQLLPTSDKPVTKGENTFIKVKISGSVKNCPNEGWVAKNFVKITEATAAQDKGSLTALPRVIRDTGRPPESVATCNEAGCNGRRTDTAVTQMNRVSTGIGQRIADDPPPVPPMPIPSVPNSTGRYLADLRALIKNPYAKGTSFRTNRGLLQIPLLGSRGNIGPCGSHHYRPNSPIGVDVYTNPLTACVLTSLMQDWRKICPDRSGCTLQFGDISHKTDPGFNGDHRTHTVGYCVDIRPMRKGGFEDSPLTYTSRNYDRVMMQKLVNLMKAKGVNTRQLFFNDTRLGTIAIPHHSDHIHACFPPSATTRAVCNNLKVDPELCPELP